MSIIRQLLILSSILSQLIGMSVSGFVQDKSTGEPLPYTNVIILENQMGTSADVNGYYILPKMTSGSYRLRLMMIGYQTIIKH